LETNNSRIRFSKKYLKLSIKIYHIEYKKYIIIEYQNISNLVPKYIILRTKIHY